MGDAWEDEGYAAEDDWGEESIAADLEQELPELGEGDEEAADELDETLPDLDEDG